MRKGKQRTSTPHTCRHLPDTNDPEQLLPGSTPDHPLPDPDFEYKHVCTCLAFRRDHLNNHV